jgi:hypothetical protein
MNKNNESIPAAIPPGHTSKDELEADIITLATKHSLTKLKTESLNFVRDYRRAEDGSFLLVSERAVVRALGKVSKVPIGEGERYADYEAAAEGVRQHWSDYFKKQRAKRSEAERRGERLRQQQYRAKRRAERERIDRQQ